MELCSDGHDEVCYDGRNCPVCEQIKETESVVEDLQKAEAEIERLKDEISELKNN